MRFFFIVTALLLFSCDASRNNSRLEGMVRELEALPHPGGTLTVATRSKVGVCGNGNHCDFFAGELRTFTSSWSEVEAFYKKFDDPEFGAPEARRVDDVNNLPCCFFEKLEDWGISKAPADNLYVLMYFRNANANNDTRCH